MKKKILIIISTIVLGIIIGLVFGLLKEEIPTEPQFDYSVFKVGQEPTYEGYKGQLVWGDKIFRRSEIYHEKDLNEYLVIVYSNRAIKSVVVFSKNNKVLYQDNVNLIDFNKFDFNKKMKYQEILELYGEPVTEMGSGECYPTYITNDGRLIHFSHCRPEGMVVECWQRIVTNEEDWISTF